MTDTNTTEPCYTCGGTYNCPDCGVWLTREDYEFAEARAWTLELAAPPPNLTRILSEEPAPTVADPAPVDLFAMLPPEAQAVVNATAAITGSASQTNEVCPVCKGAFDCRDCGVWTSEAEYIDAVRHADRWGDPAPKMTRILPTPTDPRDAEIEALRAEVAALRERLERLQKDVEDAIASEKEDITLLTHDDDAYALGFARGTISAYRWVKSWMRRDAAQ